ncbi:hypothetical protein GCM10011491_30410 [Brucella endophytica]|uniref:Uncharacterized protein n=1 Tax=Brucella endophytica TaxID=1963359 RepID=A0A916WHF5_9HYPH|nr:hypothetical protein [Brucella endophytica]GGB00076.1 hypothetical protein GCM10011491_30410 [Brucella endophytica]
MNTRARYEAQIKRSDARQNCLGQSELEDAIATLARRNGLSWFTDEQIAEIRDEMIAEEWRRRCLFNECARSWRPQKEAA